MMEILSNSIFSHDYRLFKGAPNPLADVQGVGGNKEERKFIMRGFL
jgi:hypothetical protein